MSNYEYNDIGEKLWESNPKGLVTSYRYGFAGQPEITSNALEWTARQYSREGRLTRIEYPERSFDPAHAENFWYDNEGRLVKKQTLSGALYKYVYDAAGRQVSGGGRVSALKS